MVKVQGLQLALALPLVPLGEAPRNQVAKKLPALKSLMDSSLAYSPFRYITILSLSAS